MRLRPFAPRGRRTSVAGCARPGDPTVPPVAAAAVHPADARWWITEGAPAAWRGGGAAYAIADADHRPAARRRRAQPVVPGRGQAEIGYWVAPWARGRGVATAATRALTAHAFGAGLARLELLTQPENAASQRVALAAGYRREGVRRSAGPGRDGGRYDLLAWVRLADDPPGPTPRPLPDLPDGRLTDGGGDAAPARPGGRRGAAPAAHPPRGGGDPVPSGATDQGGHRPALRRRARATGSTGDGRPTSR